MIGEVYRRAFAASVVELISLDRSVRSTDDPEAVHDARVALRRLRSYLRTFRPILEREWADSLRERMRWLDDHLGRARDSDVLVAAVERRAAAPGGNGSVPSRGLLDRLHGERARHHAEVHAALREPRYLALMEEIVAAAREPRLRETANDAARTSARKLVRSVWRRARRCVRAYQLRPEERTLHQVRVKAKHVRYAAECFAPIVGKCAKNLARRAERLQTMLGEHRDDATAIAIIQTANVTRPSLPQAPDWQPVWKKMQRAYARLT